MNKKIVLFAASAFALASCGISITPVSTESARGSASASGTSGSAADNYEMKWISPTGIPTMAFYDQGANAKWMSTATPAEFIPQAFASNNYDAIVFDGTSGLTNITVNNRNYKLARFISVGDSFSVVSVKHTAEDAFVSSYTIDAFVKTGNAAKAFISLAKNNWNWGDYSSNTAATFEDGVATVQANLVSTQGQSHDYYVIAEPVKTAVTAALKKQGVTLNTIYNLQTEWAKFHSNGKIPGGALFINNDTYASHPGAVASFLSQVDARVADAIDDPAKVVTALNAYEEATEGEDNVKARFGIPNSTIFNQIQADGKNGLGLYKDTDLASRKAIANDFNVALGGSAFDDSAFLA